MNDRGVSEVLGAVLVFGVVVMLLGLLQTFAVPQENQEIEFQHSQQVADQMTDLRAAALDVASDGGTETITLKLGTGYPTRFVLLNPTDATGTLRTTGTGDISSDGFDTEEVCGTDTSVESRTLTYEPGYSNYQSAPTNGYEHGYTYRQFDDSVRIDNEQMLVRGNTITLLPFVDEYAAKGVEKESIDITSTGMGGATISPDDDFTVSVPTQLNASVWQNHDELLADEYEDEGSNVESIRNDTSVGGRINITFAGGDGETYNVRCALLGTGTPPEGDPPEETDGGTGINPNAEGEVILERTETTAGNSSVLTLSYNPAPSDSTSEVDIVGGRISFYHVGGPGDSGGATPTQGDISGDETDSTTLEVGGEFTELNEEITVSTGTEVTVDFNEDVKDGHWYVITLEYSNGKVSTYFVAH